MPPMKTAPVARILTGLIMAGLPGLTLAQTACPTAADLTRGILLEYSTGGHEVYRPVAEGVVVVNGVDQAGRLYRLELAQGAMLLLYEDVIDGVPDPMTRLRYDYGLPPAQMPVPVPGGGWSSDVTVDDGRRGYDEPQTVTWGKTRTVSIGSCSYQAFDITIAYETADKYLERLTYIAALGLGFLTYREAEGTEPETITATAIRVAK